MKKLWAKLNRGQVPLFTTLIVAVSTVLASAFTAWGTSSSRVSAIDKEVATVKVTEELHYLEMQKQLQAIDKKLDAIGTAVRVPVFNLATSSSAK